MMMDSLEMRVKETDQIIVACQNSPCQKIVITHGTDKMVATAKASAKANLKNKTILLTEAMIPYAFGGSSDGFFQLRLCTFICSNSDSRCIHNYARTIFSLERSSKK